jgi:RimJ/RimL family protein N-acetyltransferase
MNKISLRSIRTEDAASINRIRNQSVQYLHDNTTFSIESTIQWMEKEHPDWYAILCDGEMVGYFRISNQSAPSRNLYIGADIDESHRGKGIGYESYIIMMERLFKERQLNKISLEVLGNNDRAFHLYRKLGFSVEGAKRQEVWRDGSWIDSIIMSITRKEFIAKHGKIPSPCIGICHRDENGCRTCGRTLEHISSWGRLTEQERIDAVVEMITIQL